MEKKNNLQFIFCLILCLVVNVQIHGQSNIADCYHFYDTAINDVSLNDNWIEIELLGISEEKYFEIRDRESIPTTETAFNARYYLFNDRYIMLSSLEGGNGSSYIEVGYISKSIFDRNYVDMHQSRNFITNNGIELGIEEDSFHKYIQFNWGKFTLIRPNIRIGNDIYSVYYFSCGESCNGNGYYQQFAFIKNRPLYISRYVFKNGKLIKFGFGKLPYHPTHEFEDILQ